jgi:hypothetical protein
MGLTKEENDRITLIKCEVDNIVHTIKEDLRAIPKEIEVLQLMLEYIVDVIERGHTSVAVARVTTKHLWTEADYIRADVQERRSR